MPNVTDYPDDFDREWAYRRGYAHGAAAVVAALRAQFSRRHQAQSERVAC